MSGGADVSGIDELKRTLERLQVAYTKGITDAVNTGGLIVKSYAVKQISKGSRTGEVYKRRGRTHQASAKGEFPKTDRGGLVASIAVEPGEDDRGIFCDVGTNLKYGAWLETGTKMKSGAEKMAERPWLFPSLEANKKKIETIVSVAIKSVSDKGGK